MDKKKLADLVLQKMKEKKEQQQRNRPHYQVLRLEATFAYEHNEQLKKSIVYLQNQLNKEQEILKNLQGHLQELESTGKKNYPRIIIKPEFIASENIQSAIKQFYRKCSNSFLKADLLKGKAYEHSIQRQKNILQIFQQIRALEGQIRKNEEDDRRKMNQKRVRVLKEDLRLRLIKEQQNFLRQTIEEERSNNRQLLKEYQIKKVNLQSRKERLKYVKDQIQVYKKKIEEIYNPIAYRQHLKSVFQIRTKNEMMEKNLIEITKKVQELQQQTGKCERKLEKTNSLFILGIITDSPSEKRGRIQKRVRGERSGGFSSQKVRNYYSSQRALNKYRTLSQADMSRQKSGWNLQMTGLYETKNSYKTTDRSMPTIKGKPTKRLFRE